MTNINENDESKESLGAKKKASVTVVAPSGFALEMDFHSNQKVRVLLEMAVSEFKEAGQIVDERVEFVLVRDGVDLQSESALGDAGVNAGDKLNLVAKKQPVDGCTEN